MSIWDMNSFEWFNALTPWALFLTTIDFTLLLCLDRKAVSNKPYRASFIGYTCVVLGWLIMKFGLSLSSMSALMKVSSIGWFILFPMLFIVAFNALTKLNKPKNSLAIRIGKILLSIGKFLGKLVFMAFSIVFILLTKILKKRSFDLPDNDRKHYVNPLNKTSLGVHQAFPNDYHKNHLDLL
jgi:hypothetical protein